MTVRVGAVSDAHPEDFDPGLRINTDLPFDKVLERVVGMDDADTDDLTEDDE